MSNPSLASVDGFSVSRLTYVPGKLFAIWVQGIPDGAQAVSEYELRFTRPTQVSVKVESSAALKLARINSVEFTVSGSDGSQEVRVALETGMMKMGLGEFHCSKLR